MNPFKTLKSSVLCLENCYNKKCYRPFKCKGKEKQAPIYWLLAYLISSLSIVFLETLPLTSSISPKLTKCNYVRFLESLSFISKERLFYLLWMSELIE
jgi:hypothetical protein